MMILFKLPRQNRVSVKAINQIYKLLQKKTLGSFKPLSPQIVNIIYMSLDVNLRCDVTPIILSLFSHICLWNSMRRAPNIVEKVTQYNIFEISQKYRFPPSRLLQFVDTKNNTFVDMVLKEDITSKYYMTSGKKRATKYELKIHIKFD